MKYGKYTISNPNINITEETFAKLVESNKNIFKNSICFDDPEYEQKVLVLSIMLTEMTLDSDILKKCYKRYKRKLS